MLYKTIVLQRIQHHPHLHDQLRHQRQLLAVVDRCSTNLRTRHLELSQQLIQKSPGRNPDQVTQEAFEIALEEFETHLPPEPSDHTRMPLNLDSAIAYLLNPSQAA